MTNPLFLFDLGNTNMKISLASLRGVEKSLVVPTREYTSDSLGLLLRDACSFFAIAPDQVRAWVVSSVVPPLDRILVGAAQRFFACPIYFVPHDIPLAIENRYARPREVGADRLVAAFAGRRLFEDKTLILIDFGTATTFDCVQDNAYLGGLICPGVLSSVRALGTTTAKLPQISLETTGSEVEIGRDTATSLNQGIVHGFAAMVEGLTDRLKKSLGDDRAVIVATGGFAEKIVSVCSGIDHVQPDLLMQGLRMAYRDMIREQGEGR
ncbi:type III pantothenate kinase [Desulfoplanes formicivorans]|uniref:Type III pantothenate kinase n=1 Tax=Desulfoplanes formicivorans TaxID=1592317 RepID=A0A194AF39_9BACT|nr:type III pantothenate kinase [Desulfoplanes formicivorans]GAU07948.1 type III pantothenate kinase [Desulfoplanes formicivorans]